MEVGVRVLVGARVAATDVPTRQAHPQMRPGTLAEFVAFLAPARGEGFGFGGIGGGRQVLAGLGRGIQVALSRSPPHADQDRAVRDEEVSHVGPPLLAVLVMSVLLAGVARRYDVSAPLALVVAGLLAGLIPGLHGIELEPELVLFVILPPLLWSAGLESSYVNLRRNRRPIGLLAVGPAAGDDVRGRRGGLSHRARADGRRGADARRHRGATRRGVGRGDRPAGSGCPVRS